MALTGVFKSPYGALNGGVCMVPGVSVVILPGWVLGNLCLPSGLPDLSHVTAKLQRTSGNFASSTNDARLLCIHTSSEYCMHK